MRHRWAAIGREEPGPGRAVAPAMIIPLCRRPSPPNSAWRNKVICATMGHRQVYASTPAGCRRAGVCGEEVERLAISVDRFRKLDHMVERFLSKHITDQGLNATTRNQRLAEFLGVLTRRFCQVGDDLIDLVGLHLEVTLIGNGVEQDAGAQVALGSLP